MYVPTQEEKEEEEEEGAFEPSYVRSCSRPRALLTLPGGWKQEEGGRRLRCM